MSGPAAPPTWLAELCSAPTSALEARGLLDRALDAIAEVGCREALVGIVLPRGVEARATPGLDIPPEDELRAVIADLRAGRSEIELPSLDQRLAGRVQDTGPGQVFILAEVPGGAEAAFDGWSPLLLLALARAGLVLHGRRRDREFTRLQETAQRVAASLDLDDVLSEIVRDAAELLDADSGDMLLLDDDGSRLRVVAVANFPSEMVGFEMELGEGVSSRALRARRAVIVNDYERYRHRVRRLDRYRFRAVLCAPLIARGEPIGALNVHATTTERRFGQEDARLLTTFANHAAIAIDNATRHRNEVRLAEDLVSANRELERSLTLQQRVVRQVLMDRGLDGVVSELADVLGRPVVVQDHLLRVVASASPSGERPPEEVALGGVPGDPRADEVIQRFRAGGELVAVPAAGAGGVQRIVAPIQLGSEIAGFLTFPATGSVESLDRALMEVAATGVALEFAKVRSEVSFEQRLRGDVVGDLVSRSYASEGSITARAARIGLDLSTPNDLLVLRIEEPAEADEVVTGERFLELKRRFGDVLHAIAPPGAVVALQGEVAVLLVPTVDDGRTPVSLAERLLETVREQIPGLPCFAAIGDRCDAPEDYRGSFRLALGALDAMAKLGRPGQVVDAGALGVSRLLIAAGEAPELRDFARRALGPLLGEGDRERELLSTLTAYVDAGFNQREAARKAFVHFNTVAYRLRRIEALLELDLDDPQARLDLTLALRIATLSGLSAGHNEEAREV